MNERIKQLAGQSLDKIVPYTWTKLDYDQIQKLQEHFAELIIKQCVSMCGSQADKKNISLYFGLPTEPDVKYPAAEESWSVKSQYSREYNYPK
jgi:hypothetical protein